mmetsp:Transcript_12971/g.21575  ORF Transcript_12971/g.21575 Transcript_12971/m.21575 type:complete len:318 (-) Transcript_12971:677-1630(-)
MGIWSTASVVSSGIEETMAVLLLLLLLLLLLFCLILSCRSDTTLLAMAADEEDGCRCCCFFNFCRCFCCSTSACICLALRCSSCAPSSSSSSSPSASAATAEDNAANPLRTVAAAVAPPLLRSPSPPLLLRLFLPEVPRLLLLWWGYLYSVSLSPLLLWPARSQMRSDRRRFSRRDSGNSLGGMYSRKDGTAMKLFVGVVVGRLLLLLAPWLLGASDDDDDADDEGGGAGMRDRVVRIGRTEASSSSSSSPSSASLRCSILLFAPARRLLLVAEITCARWPIVQSLPIATAPLLLLLRFLVILPVVIGSPPRRPLPS